MRRRWTTRGSSAPAIFISCYSITKSSILPIQGTKSMVYLALRTSPFTSIFELIILNRLRRDTSMLWLIYSTRISLPQSPLIFSSFSHTHCYCLPIEDAVSSWVPDSSQFHKIPFLGSQYTSSPVLLISDKLISEGLHTVSETATRYASIFH